MASKRSQTTIVPTREELEPIETASRDEIEALQLSRLQWTLQHAYDNVGAYRRKFDAAGVHPRDLKSLADLRRFPFTSKADLRENYPFGMFAVPRERVRRIHASSGTTGKATVVGYTERDLNTWSDLMARSFRAGGCRAIASGMTERQVKLITDFEPEVLLATPSYVLAILDEFRHQGIDPVRSSLRLGVFGAEPWTNAMRNEIEESFDIHATDMYGLSEVIGPGVASECVETKDGLHIWEDHFLPEIVDPATGEPLPDGESGELVFTSLSKEAMPVIRYRTRDLTRLLPGTARPMRRIEKITGRSDDMMIVRGVNVFPSQIEELILADPRLAAHFFIELRRDNRLDDITVHVEARSTSADDASRDSAGHDLGHRIKAMIGINARIDVVIPGAIERSMGKAVRIRDLRPKA
jgi:phenylacetate-CoA ligase